ncbi:fumarylacetoacetate hydrolase family protein [Planobispora rosea]|nr:fumarylacetoacetate hydrolase family protein [Planobispora rosea]
MESIMRLATFQYQGLRRSGVVDGDAILPFPRGAELLDVIRTGSVPDTGAAVPLTEVRLLPPVEPPAVRDFVTFEEHVEGVRRSVSGAAGVPDAWYDAPTFYFTNPYAMIGAHDDVPVPPGCRALDFELEVAAVIGREGRDLSPAQARDHIFGYTIFNDWSARDLQSREMQVGLGPCKGKDSATTLGPWLVTADELEPYRDAEGFLRLALTAEVNGAVVGRDLLSNMGWPFEDLVAYASRGAPVRPGDVLGSGTCGNGGCLAELWGLRGRQDPPPLKPGDVVTLTVEGIGAVSNTVVPGTVPEPVPPARKRPRDRPRDRP